MARNNTTICLPPELKNDEDLFKNLRYEYESLSNFVRIQLEDFKNTKRGGRVDENIHGKKEKYVGNHSGDVRKKRKL